MQGNYSFEIDSDDYIKQDYPISLLIILYALIGWFLLSASICLSKMSIWEDIYGRSLVGTIISYIWMVHEGISPFEVPAHIRKRVFVMETLYMIAFIFAMLGISNLSAVSGVAVLLSYFTLSDSIGLTRGKDESPAIVAGNFICLGTLIIGLVLISSPLGIVVSGVDQTSAVILLVLSLIIMSFGKSYTNSIKQVLPLSTGMFMFNFFLILFIPAFIIVSFSIKSASVEYKVQDLYYFAINGIITWFGIYGIVRVFQFDKSNKLEVLSYLALLYPAVFNYFIKEVFSEYISNGSTDSTQTGDSGTTHSNTDGESTEIDIIGHHILGNVEYLAAAIMYVPRLLYYVIRLKKK